MGYTLNLTAEKSLCEVMLNWWVGTCFGLCFNGKKKCYNIGVFYEYFSLCSHELKPKLGQII